MAKPILNPLNAFSYNKDYTVTFVYSGNQFYKISLIVKSATTDNTVYSGEIETYKQIYTIPANSISVESGNLNYTIQVKVTQTDGTESLWSDKVFVSILTEPQWYFNGITNGYQYNSSSLTATMHYSQSESELLKEYKFYLYDSTNDLINESDILYDLDNIAYTYNGLENGTYYIRCYGQTVNGYELDTGKISIHVSYKTQSYYSTFYIDNDKQHGYIKYYTNIIIIKYNGDEKFEFEDGKINVVDKKLYYDSGFNLEGDGTFVITGTNLHREGLVFLAKNNYNILQITSYIYDDDSVRFKLSVQNGLVDYVLYSDALTFTDDDRVGIWFRRINNVYKLIAKVDNKTTSKTTESEVTE